MLNQSNSCLNRVYEVLHSLYDLIHTLFKMVWQVLFMIDWSFIIGAFRSSGQCIRLFVNCFGFELHTKRGRIRFVRKMGISKSKEVLLNSSMQNKILFILILIQIHCAVLTSQDKSISLAGIRDKVTITIDTWGVCHIMASNEEDMFYAQGWNCLLYTSRCV